MYSSASISILEERIGFGRADLEDVTVDPQHLVGTSGRTLPYFHRLATLKNIYKTVEKPTMDSAEFNAYLEQMKVDAVKHVLSAILDRHRLYVLERDYSDIIIGRPELFDGAVGYALAISAIEQMVSTSRSNYIETSAKLSYQQLKMELEGVVDDAGRVRSVGLKQELHHSIRQAIRAIFKEGVKIFDASDVW